MNTSWLVVVVLLAVSLAGCTVDDDTQSALDGVRADSTDSGEVSHVDEELLRPSEGIEGEPSLAVRLESDVLNGTIPFTANVTLSAQAFDLDGTSVAAAFSWEVTSEDAANFTESGSEVPHTFPVNITAPGNHTFTVSLSAQGFPSKTASVTIEGLYDPIVLDLSAPAEAYVAEPFRPQLAISGGIGGFQCVWEGDVVWDNPDSCSPQTEFTESGSASTTVAVSDGITTETMTLHFDVRLPSASGAVTGSIFAYNQPPACIGVSNIGAIATELAGDPVPKFPAGTTVCLSARSVNLEGLEMEMFIFTSEGEIFDGPFSMGSASPETLGGGGYAYSGPNWEIPATTTAGTYYIGIRFTTESGFGWLSDGSVPSPEGHKMVEILGSPIG